MIPRQYWAISAILLCCILILWLSHLLHGDIDYIDIIKYDCRSERSSKGFIRHLRIARFFESSVIPYSDSSPNASSSNQLNSVDSNIITISLGDSHSEGCRYHLYRKTQPPGTDELLISAEKYTVSPDILHSTVLLVI